MVVQKRKNIPGSASHHYDESVDSFVPASSSTPLPVAVISGGGGGTQYTEGDTDASITGTAMMMEGAGNALVPAQGTVADGLLVNLGSNNDVTVTSSALPSGAATEAKQDTIIGHVDGIEGLLTTIDADTGNISTKIDTIAGAVSGTEMQVDVLTMPTVTVTATNLDIRDLTSVSDSVAAVQSGAWTVDTELPTAAALADNTANPTVPSVGSLGLFYDGSTWDRMRGDSTDGLLVNLGTNNDVTVTSGSITETNSSAIAASLSVLDDWDETDRAKVNPIVGQAGVQGNSGTVSANTQRVVLATDVALPAGTNAIGKLAANSGVDIGDVDVTSVIPGTGATNLGKAEDAAHSSGDTGVMTLGVRNDNLNTNLSDANGDYTPFATETTGRVFTRSSLEFNTAQQTFTVTGATGPVDGTKRPFKYYSLQVTEAGTVTSWTVELQGSNNNSNWTIILTHTRAVDGAGTTKWESNAKPCSFYRVNVSALTLGGGTSITVYGLGTQ